MLGCCRLCWAHVWFVNACVSNYAESFIVKSESLDYLLQHQCSRQWKGFLSALATEFASQIDVGELRALMSRVGVRFGKMMALPVCTNIEDIQYAMNAVWHEMDWGWVEIEERDRALSISHFCSPLVVAFGKDMQPWTPAFLEGVYQQWLAALGASESLRVRQVSQVDELGRLEYRLSQ